MELCVAALAAWLVFGFLVAALFRTASGEEEVGSCSSAGFRILLSVLPCAGAAPGFASPLALYSASELLCSPSVVKTANTRVTQRINGNGTRLVLVDNQYFPPHPLWAGGDDV